MHYRRLGRTELMVSEVGFGGLPIGGRRWGGVRDEDSLAALQRSYDCGVTFYDTADIYGWGHSEELIAQALGEVRTRVIIATKFGADFRFGEPVRHVYTPEYLNFAIDESLRRLRTDYIDVYQVHNPPQKLAKEEAIWDALAALKAEGKVRAFGVSCRTANDAVAYLRAEEKFGARFGDTLQVAYNLIDQEAAAKDVFVEAHRQDRGVIGRVPLASGMLSGKYDRYHAFAPGDFRNDWGPARRQATAKRLDALSFLERPDRTLAQAAIAFCLSEPAMGTVITGARTPEQAEENASASGVAPLSMDELTTVRLT